MTHPFHPHCDRSFPGLHRGLARREDRVVLQDADDTVFRLLIRRTDLSAPNPRVALAEGRVRFPVPDLV